MVCVPLTNFSLDYKSQNKTPVTKTLDSTKQVLDVSEKWSKTFKKNDVSQNYLTKLVFMFENRHRKASVFMLVSRHRKNSSSNEVTEDVRKGPCSHVVPNPDSLITICRSIRIHIW